MAGSRQRYGILLVALGTTFLFEGLAQPGVVQRAVAAVMVGATLMLALYAAEIRRWLLGVAGAVIPRIVTGVVIATAVGKRTTVEAIYAIVNGLFVGLAPPAVVIGVRRNLRTSGTVTITVVYGVSAYTCWSDCSSPSCTSPFRTWVAPHSSQPVSPPHRRARSTSASPR